MKYTTILAPYLQYWHYYKTNQCLPPISLGTLQSIEAIYRRELHPAPVRLYCGVCVADMFTSLFGAWEREATFAKAMADEKEKENAEVQNPGAEREPKKRKNARKRKAIQTSFSFQKP